MLRRLLPHAFLLLHAFACTGVTLLLARMSWRYDAGLRLPWITVAAGLLGLATGLALRLNGMRRPQFLLACAGLGVMANGLLYTGCVRLATDSRDPFGFFISLFGPASPLGAAAPPILAALSVALISALASAAIGVLFERPGSAREPSILPTTAVGVGLTVAVWPFSPAVEWLAGSLTPSLVLFSFFFFCAYSVSRARATREGATDPSVDPAPLPWLFAGLTRQAAGPLLVGVLLGGVGFLLFRATTIAPPLASDAFSICLLTGGAGALLTPFLRRMRAAWVVAILAIVVAAAIFAANVGPIAEGLRILPLPGTPRGLLAGPENSFRGVFLSTPWPFFALASLLVGVALQALSPLRERRCTSRVTLSALAGGGAIGVTALALLLPHLGSLGLNDDGKALVSVHESSGWVEVRPRRGNAPPLVTIDRRGDLGPTDADEAWARRIQAHLPLLLHPAPRRVLILGEITGDATRAALRHPDLEIEVAWVSPSLAAHFGPAIHAEADRLRRPRPIVRTEGPRVLIEKSPAAFDVIVDLSGLGRVDAPVHYFTEEFVGAARRALRPNGIHASWFALVGRTPGMIASLALAAALPESVPLDPMWECSAALDPRRPTIGFLRFIAPMSRVEPFDPATIAARIASLDTQRELDALSLFALIRGRAGIALPPVTADAAALGGASDGAPYRPCRETAHADSPATRAWIATYLEKIPTDAWKVIVTVTQEVRTAMESAERIRGVALVRCKARAGDGFDGDVLDAAREAALRCLEATPDLAFVRAFVLRTAAALTARNRFDEADALWKLAVDKAPDWGEAHLGRADVVYRSHANFTRPEDWKPLKELAERAIALDETLARAWIYSGIADLHGTGDFRSARGCLDNAAKIDPDDPLLKAFQWRFLDADGRFEEAAALLLDALEAFPDDMRIRDAVFKMVPKLRLTGKPKTALYVLQKIEPSYREQAGYFLVLAEILDDLGDLDGAVRAARKCAAATDPPIQGYFVYLYRLLLKAGMDREAGETRGYIVDQFGYDPGVTDPDASGR